MMVDGRCLTNTVTHHCITVSSIVTVLSRTASGMFLGLPTCVPTNVSSIQSTCGIDVPL